MELCGRNIRAQWSTDLHAAHGTAASRATADIMHKFAKRDAERNFVKATMLYVPGDLDGHSAPGSASAECGICFATML